LFIVDDLNIIPSCCRLHF